MICLHHADMSKVHKSYRLLLYTLLWATLYAEKRRLSKGKCKKRIKEFHFYYLHKKKKKKWNECIKYDKTFEEMRAQ